MLYPGCLHIFTGLEYSGASARGHTYFPVVQCIGLEYSVLAGRADQGNPCQGVQPEGQGGQAERPAGGAVQYLARPPDAEAAVARGAGGKGEDESD